MEQYSAGCLGVFCRLVVNSVNFRCCEPVDEGVQSHDLRVELANLEAYYQFSSSPCEV